MDIQTKFFLWKHFQNFALDLTAYEKRLNIVKINKEYTRIVMINLFQRCFYQTKTHLKYNIFKLTTYYLKFTCKVKWTHY